MNNCECGKDNPTLAHVKCDVKNCIYNNHQCCCTASAIQVGPQSACDCQETNCQTFKARK